MARCALNQEVLVFQIEFKHVQPAFLNVILQAVLRGVDEFPSILIPKMRADVKWSVRCPPIYLAPKTNLINWLKNIVRK